MALRDEETLILALTHRCNMACDYCVVEKRDISMPWETARLALEGFLRAGAGRRLRVRLFGGEPFLEFDLLERAVDFVAGNAPAGSAAMDVTTNASLLDSEKIAFLKNRPALEVIISLDGADSTNEAHRRGGVSVSGLMRRFGAELLSLPSVSVNKVVSPRTVETLTQDFIYIAELGFRRINILPAYYMEWSGAALKKLGIQLDGILSVLKVLKKHGTPVDIKNAELRGDKPLFNAAVVVDTDGAMYSSNLFMHRLVYPFREGLARGRVDDFAGFSPCSEGDRAAMERYLPEEILRSSYRADLILGEFVSRL